MIHSLGEMVNTVDSKSTPFQGIGSSPVVSRGKYLHGGTPTTRVGFGETGSIIWGNSSPFPCRGVVLRICSVPLELGGHSPVSRGEEISPGDPQPPSRADALVPRPRISQPPRWLCTAVQCTSRRNYQVLCSAQACS